MKYYLVKYHTEADSRGGFEAYGMKIMNGNTFKRHWDLIKNYFEDHPVFVCPLGDHHEIYHGFDEFEDSFECKEITRDEYNALKNTMGLSYGIFPKFSRKDWWYKKS